MRIVYLSVKTFFIFCYPENRFRCINRTGFVWSVRQIWLELTKYVNIRGKNVFHKLRCMETCHLGEWFMWWTFVLFQKLCSVRFGSVRFNEFICRLTSIGIPCSNEIWYNANLKATDWFGFSNIYLYYSIWSNTEHPITVAI